MIEQIGDAWRKVMGLVDDLEVQKELEEGYRTFCGLDRQSAEHLDLDTLRELLTEERLLALSELTYVRAERFGPKLEPDALSALYLRALALLVGIEEEEIAQLRVARALELLEKVGEELPDETVAEAVGFLALGGAYSDAEDLLFRQLEHWQKGRAPQALLEAGRALYAHLEAQSDEALIRGNLPRTELAQGKAALSAWETGA